MWTCGVRSRSILNPQVLNSFRDHCINLNLVTFVAILLFNVEFCRPLCRRSFLENTYKCIPAISKEDHQRYCWIFFNICIFLKAIFLLVLTLVFYRHFREIEKLLKEFKARSNFQLLCFDESGSVETKSWLHEICPDFSPISFANCTRFIFQIV